MFRFERFLVGAMVALGLLSLGISCALAQDPEPITTIEKVHAVPPSDLSKMLPVDMECVVLCCEPDWPILFVSDGTHGMYAGSVRNYSLKRGDRIRIRGRLGENRFPVDMTIEPSDNHLEIPLPKLVEFEVLQAGQEDSQLVEIEGQLVGVEKERFQTSLEMRSNAGGRFRALLHTSRADAQQLNSMLGKRLRLRGVVGARFDELQRWSGFQIWLSDPTNIEELERPGVPLELPVTPIGQLSAETIIASHSTYFRTTGTATYQVSSSIVLLQDDNDQLFVELQHPGPLPLDKSYDVLGTLDTSVIPPLFRMAVAAPSSRQFLPSHATSPRTVDELIAGDFSGQLVRTVGTYAGPLEFKEQHGFLLRSKNNLLPVFVQGGSVGEISPGTQVEAEGIWIQQKSLVGFNIGSSALHARLTGIHVGSQTPWLLLSVLGIAGVVSVGTTLWAVTLRKLVRRRTQQFLDSVKEQRRTEEQYANIFIHARVMVMTTDELGKILAVNHATLRATKREQHHLLGTNVTDLVEESSKEGLRSLLQTAMQSDKTISCHVAMLDASGASIWQEVSCWAVQQSGACFFHMIWHDITERLNIEQQRAEMEQRMLSMQKMESLGVLAGGIAHDFNNLLTVIVGHASLMSMSPSMNPSDRESLTSIQQASERAAELTQQMLAYAGRGKFDIQVLDISQVVSELAQLLSVSIPKNLELCFDLQGDLPGAKADATQLRQILMNLVRNAAEAMSGRDGSIHVRTCQVDQLPQSEPSTYVVSFVEATESSSSYVCLEVSDEGIGIDSANLHSIFDPFFSTKFSGRGLGLALVLGIVRGHKGCLEVLTQAGKGATFRIYLKTCADPMSIIPAPHRVTRQLDIGDCVLVVDDEPEVLMALAKTLESVGLDVTRCTSGEEALQVLRQSPARYACLVTDQTMPDMSGLELCLAVQEIDRNLPAILVSGYSVDLIRGSQAPQCYRAFLQKPYSPDKLIDQVHRAISERRVVGQSR